MRVLRPLTGHRKFAESASAYADGALSGAAAARFEAHLQSCEECASRVADYRAMRRMLAVTPALQPSRSFRLTPAMAAEARPVPQRPAPRLALRVAQTTAGLALLAFVGTFTAGLMQGGEDDDSGAISASAESAGNFSATDDAQKSQGTTQDALAPATGPAGLATVAPIATPTPTVIAASGAGSNGTTTILPTPTPTLIRPPQTGPGALFATQTAAASTPGAAASPRPPTSGPGGDGTPVAVATPRPPATGPGEVTPVPTEASQAYLPPPAQATSETQALTDGGASGGLTSGLSTSLATAETAEEDGSGVSGMLAVRVALGALALVAIGSAIVLSRRTVRR